MEEFNKSTSAPAPETAPIPAEQKMVPTHNKFKLSKKIIILTGILLVILAGVTAYLIFVKNAKEPQSLSQASNNQPVTSPSSMPSTVNANLPETKSIDILNPLALIRAAFVRNGSIYLYEDGKEKLVAKAAQETTQQACYNLTYPFLSPSGKYLAYIEQIGEQPGYGGCLEGFLRIVDTSTGVNKPTSYKVVFFNWTPSNLLNFSPGREASQAPRKYTVKNIYFDPTAQKETVFETVIDQDKNTWADTMLSADYPSDDLNKLVRFKDSKYYFVDNGSNKEILLFDKTQITGFLHWSPSGRYAVFESIKKPTKAFNTIELIVDTQNLSATPKEITVGLGSAGGDFSTGRKWYFEKGFVTYCRQDLYFVDGSQPLELTNDGGGGCHNEEGFVATSPGGEYAFVKFKDRFEVHTKDGNKTAIKETTALTKARGEPKNLIWLNDDYMVIFESTYGGYSGSDKKPNVHLFDRKANIIKPLIENAYLIDSLPN